LYAADECSAPRKRVSGGDSWAAGATHDQHGRGQQYQHAVEQPLGDDVVGRCGGEQRDPGVGEDVEQLDQQQATPGVVEHPGENDRSGVLRAQAEELRASRQRIVSAQDAERRRRCRSSASGRRR